MKKFIVPAIGIGSLVLLGIFLLRDHIPVFGTSAAQSSFSEESVQTLQGIFSDFDEYTGPQGNTFTAMVISHDNTSTLVDVRSLAAGVKDLRTVLRTRLNQNVTITGIYKNNIITAQSVAWE